MFVAGLVGVELIVVAATTTKSRSSALAAMDDSRAGSVADRARQ